MKKDMLEKGAVLQRDNETYAITPPMLGGLTDGSTLKKIGEVAEKYEAKAVKITSGQRIAIVGIKEEDVDSAWNDLGMKPKKSQSLCIRSVKVCPGTRFCKIGQQDAIGVGEKLNHLYYDTDLPSKLKIAVSGCGNSCAENHFRDIGICGTEKGYYIQVGGHGGKKPRIADIIYDNVDEEKIVPIVDDIVKTYSKYGEENERLGELIDRVGLDNFKGYLQN